MKKRQNEQAKEEKDKEKLKVEDRCERKRREKDGKSADDKISR